MDASGHKEWLRTVLILGVLYVLAGVAFGAIAGSAGSNQMRTMWRVAAWLTSAVAFTAHIGYEHFRLRNSRVTIALHASLAAALGAFGLAVAANVHAQSVATANHRLLAIALAVWPAMTALPAFIVALAMAVVLARMRPNQ